MFQELLLNTIVMREHPKMLKAIFILDCHECHRSFERVAAITEQNPELMTTAWLDAVDQVTYWAEQSCWGIDNNIHFCPWCLKKGFHGRPQHP
jgi:hypothetical protein